MIGAFDIGYHSVKGIGGSEGKRFTFPSVVGTPEAARVSLNGHNASTISLLLPQHVSVGNVSQSYFATRLEDRDWIMSDVWYSLMAAALTEITTATVAEVNLVVGLPVSFFEQQKNLVRDRLLGEHRVQRQGQDRRAQVFRIANVRVITQPMGTFLASVMDKNGKIEDEARAHEAVGIVDVGGKTTNLSIVEQVAEHSQSFSIDAGGWDVMRYVRGYLDARCPELDIRDAEVSAAIQAGEVGYFDKMIDLTPVIREAGAALAGQITGAATQLWNGGAGLRSILITGGGAHLVGQHLIGKWKHARVVDDPVFSNVTGYWKLARRLWGG